MCSVVIPHAIVPHCDCNGSDQTIRECGAEVDMTRIGCTPRTGGGIQSIMLSPIHTSPYRCGSDAAVSVLFNPSVADCVFCVLRDTCI